MYVCMYYCVEIFGGDCFDVFGVWFVYVWYEYGCVELFVVEFLVECCDLFGLCDVECMCLGVECV